MSSQGLCPVRRPITNLDYVLLKDKGGKKKKEAESEMFNHDMISIYPNMPIGPLITVTFTMCPEP
jgi:hypothetical protein